MLQEVEEAGYAEEQEGEGVGVEYDEVWVVVQVECAEGQVVVQAGYVAVREEVGTAFGEPVEVETPEQEQGEAKEVSVNYHWGHDSCD